MAADRNESFELIKYLGTGGFAQTWLARILDPDLLDEWGCEEIAMKIPISKSKERALRKEVELASSLYMQLTDIESENIVRYLGFEIFDGKPVMIMQYVGGGNLRELMGPIGKWQGIGVDRALSIAQGILRGLSAIHGRHIVHRDIKPENILMDGIIPKISDFGVGRMLRSDELASTTAGTLYYMSPELLFKESGASYNTDLWSLGVILYEMLCMRFPFGVHEKMPPGRVAALIGDDDVKLEFPPAQPIPRRLQNIIAKALRRDPEARYGSAREMLRDIEKLIVPDDAAVELEIGPLQHLLYNPLTASLAEEKLNGLMQRFPRSPHLCLLLGEFYNRCGNYDRATEMFVKGLEHDPESAMLNWGKAMSHQKKGETSLAITSLKEAISIGLEASLERYAHVLLRTLEGKGDQQ